MRKHMIGGIAILIVLAMPSAEAQYNVVEQYHGTTELPSGIAYKHFVNSLAYEHEHPSDTGRHSHEFHMIARALNLEPTVENELTLLEMLEYSLAVHDEVTEDIALAKRIQTCEIATNAVSERGAFMAIDQVDLLVREKWQQAYIQTLEFLDEQYRDAFRKEIARRKLSISYTRITAESYASKRNISGYELSQEHCEAAESTLTESGG